MGLKADAEHLWDQAMDGNRVTDTEERTLKYIMSNYRMNTAAKTLLEKRIIEYRQECQPSKDAGTNQCYYQKIDGRSYKRQLLQLAETLSAERTGGVLQLRDVMDIWAKAQDGNQVTDCEWSTLEHIRNHYREQRKLDQDASKALDACLADKDSQTLQGSGSAARAALRYLLLVVIAAAICSAAFSAVSSLGEA